jgi:nucleolar protein 9
MKSVFEEKGKGRADAQKIVPPQFSEMSRRFLQQFRDSHDENEIRAMAASSVASPCLKVRIRGAKLLVYSQSNSATDLFGN